MGVIITPTIKETYLSWLEQPAHNRSILGSSPRVSISPDEGVTFIGCRFSIRNKRELELDDENLPIIVGTYECKIVNEHPKRDENSKELLEKVRS